MATSSDQKNSSPVLDPSDPKPSGFAAVACRIAVAFEEATSLATASVAS